MIRRVMGLLACLSVLSTPAAAGDCKSAVEAFLGAWKSSDRYIPGGILRRQAETHVPKDVRLALVRDCDDRSVVQALKALGADRGVAENVLKQRQIQALCLEGECPFEKFPESPLADHEDEVRGLSQATLDARLRDFPEAAAPVGFRLREYYLRRLLDTPATNNDHYAFTVPGVLFSEGFHERYEAVFETVSRGADEFPFLVTFGQDQVLDMLEGMHFTRFEVEALKRRVGEKFQPDPRFWDWLLQWRFRGTVKGLPAGTVVPANTPALYVVTDPVSGLIVETRVNAIMSSMTKLMTNAARLMIAKGGIRSITEAGTRRLVTGQLSALTGLFAGADGTSNVFMAELLGKPSYGTMPHSSVMMFPDEETAFERILAYAKGKALLLPDTYSLLDGIRTAVRVGGDQVGMIRQDSNLPGKSTLETVEAIHALWSALGRPSPHAVTNDLNEQTLEELARDAADRVDMVSIGGGFAAGPVPHGNYVYKLVEVRDRRTGDVRYPIKVANGAKSTEPGEKEVHGVYDAAGRLTRVVKLFPGEAAPAGSRRWDRVLMRDGRRVESRATPDAVAKAVLEQVGTLPPPMRDLSQTRGRLRDAKALLEPELSPKLAGIRTAALAAVVPPVEERVLVVFGSFDPTTDEGHVLLARRMNELYRNRSNPDGFTKILFVPTNDRPAHGRHYALAGPARVMLLKDKLRGLPQAEVWEGEVNDTSGEPPRTWDTLQAIRARFPKAKIFAAFGDDAFWSIGREGEPWKNADRLLAETEILVAERTTPRDRKAEERYQADVADTTRRLAAFEKKGKSFVTPSGTRIQFLSLHLPPISASEVRAFYDRQGVAGRLHLTDPQWTFLKRSALPGARQREDGGLAVNGTERTVANIVRAVHAADGASTMLVTTSGDAHYPVELADSRWNGEFHPPYTFPVHGMKGVEGPTGDDFIEELDPLIPPSRQLRIPAHRQEETAAGPVLALEPFSLDSLGTKLADPRYVLRFEKNGPGSYSVLVNPRYPEYLRRIDPHRLLPHFHTAWCADFCTYYVAKWEAAQGYRVYLLVDGTAGVFPRLTGMRLRELRRLGVRFMATAELEKLVKGLGPKPTVWAMTNALAEWERTSPTMAWMDAELGKAEYGDLTEGEAEEPGTATVFQPPTSCPRALASAE